jgi:hypothetical protein
MSYDVLKQQNYKIKSEGDCVVFLRIIQKRLDK